MTTARTLTVWQYANNATVSVSGAQSVSWATSIASPQSLYVGKTNSGNAKIYVDALTTTSLPPINPWAPTYTSSANTYATKNIAYSYHVTLNESSTFSLINGGGFLTVSNSKNGTAGTSFYLNGTPSSSGSKSIKTKAVSVAGTLTAYQNYTVNVNNTWSPTWTSSLPATGQVGVFWSYHLTCNESVAFTINTKPAWATWASGNSTLYGTPSSSGAASFKLDATSTAGLLNAWQNGSSVISPDWAPTFTSSPGTIGQVGVFYSYHPTLNETGTITELQKPSWAIWASGNSTLYGTPTSSGIVQFELNSLSTAGKLSKTQWWNVSVSPDWAPTYLSTPITTGQVGVSYSYSLTINETGTVTAISLPSWATLSHNGTTTSPWVLGGTPTSSGAQSVKIKAQSSAGLLYAYQNFSIVVSPDWSPTWTSSPNGSVLKGTFYTYHIVLNESTTVTAISLPSWLTLSHNGTATTPWYLNGTANVATGAYPVKLKALSSAGLLYAYQNFSISVTWWAPHFTTLPPLYYANGSVGFYYLGYSAPTIYTVIAAGEDYHYEPACNESVTLSFWVTYAPGVDSNNTWQNYPDAPWITWAGGSIDGSNASLNGHSYLPWSNAYGPGLWFFYLKAVGSGGDVRWQNWTLEVVYWTVAVRTNDLSQNVTLGDSYSASLKVMEVNPYPHAGELPGYFPVPLDQPRYFIDIMESLTVTDLWSGISINGTNNDTAWLNWSLDSSRWSAWTDNYFSWINDSAWMNGGYWQIDFTGTPTSLGVYSVNVWLHSKAGLLIWNNVNGGGVVSVTYPYPTILTTAPTLGVVGVLYIYIAQSDQASVTWSLSSLGNAAWWITCLNITGEMAGVPDTPGIYNLTLTVTNQYNESASQTWDVFVQFNPAGNGNGNGTQGGGTNGTGGSTIIIMGLSETDLMYLAITIIVIAVILVVAVLAGRRRR